MVSKERTNRAGKTSARCREAGFSLVEVTVAVFVLGTIVIAAISAIGFSARGAARQEGTIFLTVLARNQIELIQQASFRADAGYPIVQDVPVPYSVAFTVTDPGTTYTYPIINETISGVVQQIAVTATGEFGSVTFTFYKIKPKWKSL